MAEDKRLYTRAELVGAHCGICGSQMTHIDNTHTESCPLADKSVTGLVFVKYRASIVFRLYDGRWWWRGCSGAEYRIEKMCGGYVMLDAADKEIAVRQRLKDIKNYLILNQGVY